MTDLSYTGANTRFAYTLNGSHVAKLRCSQLSMTYGVNSDESHARQMRAFYPHLRFQGSFVMKIDSNGWEQHNETMAWFKNYVDALLAAKNPSPMLVRMDSRNFVRLGFPTSGPAFGDHKGSMVFSPTLTFISVNDPRDSKTNIVKTASASQAQLPTKDETAANWFYPDSKLNRPGALESEIYDVAITTAALSVVGLQGLVNGGATTPPDASQENLGGDI